MKNLLPYSGDCFEVHKKAVDRKHSGDLKDRLLKLNPDVQIAFQNFLSKFQSNILLTLQPDSKLSLAKNDLLSLYHYQSSTILAVRNNIRNHQIKTIISTCQNCTIDTANTLDHILPKANFPEFVVNPINLFPCCSACNSYKLEVINNNGNQSFLNLYLDKLPNEQYLFVDITMAKGEVVDINYRLDNVNNKIDSNLFSVISYHYKNLNLFERMKFKSIEYLSEFNTKLSVFIHSLSMEEIKTNLLDAIVIDKEAYGQNYWRCILEDALLTNSEYLNSIVSKAVLGILTSDVPKS